MRKLRNLVDGRGRKDGKRRCQRLKADLNDMEEKVNAETELQEVMNVSAKDRSLSAEERKRRKRQRGRERYIRSYLLPLTNETKSVCHSRAWIDPMQASDPGRRPSGMEVPTWRRCGAAMSSMSLHHGSEAQLRGELLNPPDGARSQEDSVKRCTWLARR